MTNPNLREDERLDSLHPGSPLTKEHKVVVRLRSGEVVKGHVNLSGVDMADPFPHSDHNSKAPMTVRVLNSNAAMQVALSDVKAVFFVKSFRGDPKRKNLRFYTNGPTVGEIWAEIRFTDNEIIEATIENSMQHLMGDGFLLHPSDANGNNTLIYVNKSAIANYRVLGVRAHRERDE